MKINRFYSNYIIFVFIVKIIFLILAITNKYLLIKGNNPTLQKQVYIWREKVEYFFVILMALLCIGLFNPFYKGDIIIDGHTRMLLFIYGFVILLTSKGMILG
jgi:hypothetical protein